jgi:GNAT superfamily N-acetyltransferase
MVLLLQELFAIEDDFTPDPCRQRSGLNRFLDGCGKHRCIRVAEADAMVVAMATIQILISTAQGGPVGLVEDVVVRHDYRGRGIGSRLMTDLTAWAAERGLMRLQIIADRDNRRALHFYQKAGWKTTQLIALRRGTQ